MPTRSTTTLNPGSGGANIVTFTQSDGSTEPVSDLSFSPDGQQDSKLATGVNPFPVQDVALERRAEELVTNTQALVDALTSGPLPTIDLAGINATTSTAASTPTQLAVGTAAVRVFAANLGRKRVFIQNSGTTPVYLGFGAPPTTITHHVELAPCSNYSSDGTGGTWTEDVFKGDIWAISTTSAGAINAFEMI